MFPKSKKLIFQMTGGYFLSTCSKITGRDYLLLDKKDIWLLVAAYNEEQVIRSALVELKEKGCPVRTSFIKGAFSLMEKDKTDQEIK